MLNKPEAGLLNKSSCLAPALGVTKFAVSLQLPHSTSKIIVRTNANPYHCSFSFQFSVDVRPAESGNVVSFAHDDCVAVTHPVTKFGRHDVAVVERQSPVDVEAAITVLLALVDEVDEIGIVLFLI
jgi:hypothetical protein